MATRKWTRIPLVVIVLLTLAFSGPGFGIPGAQAREHEKEDPRSVPVKTLDEAIKSGRIPRESVAAAQKDGMAPVLIRVKLPTDFQPEGELSNPRVEEQRMAIAAAQRSILKRIDGLKFDDVKQYESIPWMAIWADTATLNALVANPDVFRITVDGVDDLQLGTSVPRISGDVVWQSLGNAGGGQTVAILDTGVDGTIPALAGKVVSEGCFSTSFPFVSRNLCPNGSDSTAAGSGVPCAIDDCDHGSHVAGIAAANDGTTFGVAPMANIISIQVFSDFGGDLGARVSDQIEGLERVYALRNNFNIAAVNMSLGAGFYTSQSNCDDDNKSRKDIIDNLRAAGIPTVVASGNDAIPFQLGIATPACISSAISVGATMGGGAAEAIAVWRDRNGQITDASQTAPFLDLLAPGTNIRSTVPPGGDPANATKSGTSMAAPHVTGALAVLRSQQTSASVGAMLNALTATGVPITDTRPAQPITTPRIRLDLAVETLTQRPLPPTGLQVDNVSGTWIEASWTDNSVTETSFVLTATPPQSTLLPSRSATVGAGVTSAVVGAQTANDGTVLKLRPDTTYTLTVRACNAAGNCAESAPITARTANTVPAPPTNLRGTNVTSSGVTLAWDYTGANPVTEFRLVRYVCGLGYDCNPATQAISLSGSTRSFTVDNLVGNWTVQWRLQACNADGCNLTWVDGPRIDAPNPGFPPAAPTNLHVCGQGSDPFELCLINRVTLIWNDNASNEDRYEFEWSIAQPGTPPWEASWSRATLGPNARSYSFTSSSLISGTIYYFRVRACNIYGCSSYSNMVSYSTP